ncbi:restriction endonuclease subunit S [Xanthomonas oryzae]|uniref:restriction endonuclease subunit S n=1 Tax=Xanthomonas oryzae TaxID=347 RepID=UPI003D9FED42
MSELPVGWVEVEIGDLCELVNGRAFKPQEWCKEGLPIIRIQNLNRPDAAFNFFKGELDPRHFVVAGQLLFAWSGTPGTSFGAHIWNGPSAALNQHIFKIEFDTEQLDKTFFRHAINQKLDELIGSAQGGVGLRHVTKVTFERTQITLPPLVEQKRIAQKLDALLAQVDTLKARIDAIPALLKRFRKSVIHSAVIGRLSADLRVPIEKSEEQEQLGPLELWREVALASLGELSRGKSKHRPRNDSRLYGSAYPFIQTGDVANSRGTLTSSKVFYSEFGLKQSRLFPSGTLCITIAANIADTAMLAIDACFPDSVVGFIPNKDDCVAQFIKYVIDDNKESLEALAPATAQKNINLKVLNQVKLRIPPIKEQTEIVRRVEQLFAYADQLEAKVAAAQQRIDALTQSLLAKAFRGELVPQDPGDEPASVLLQRIRAQRAAAPKPKRGRKAATS